MTLARKLTPWSPKLMQGEQMTPEVGYVQIADLNFDWQRWENGQSTGYQRPLDTDRVAKYHDVYDPHLVRPIVANRRADGSLWVVDGQHTVALAKSLGQAVVLATIWNGLSAQEEAARYNSLNSERVKNNQWNRFGARASSGEPKVLAVLQLVSECGFKTGTADRSTNSIAAVSALERLYDASPTLLRQTLTKVRQMWPTDVLTRDGVFISGLASFTFTWDEPYWPTSVGIEGDVIDWTRFDSVFTKMTGRDIVRSVKLLRIESGMAINSAAYATAFRDAYNGKSNFRRRLVGKPVSPSSGRRSIPLRAR